MIVVEIAYVLVVAALWTGAVGGALWVAKAYWSWLTGPFGSQIALSILILNGMFTAAWGLRHLAAFSRRRFNRSGEEGPQ
jgi:energy-coupling factor transporter transmembrane protein EcfT